MMRSSYRSNFLACVLPTTIRTPSTSQSPASAAGQAGAALANSDAQAVVANGGTGRRLVFVVPDGRGAGLAPAVPRSGYSCHPLRLGKRMVGAPTGGVSAAQVVGVASASLVGKQEAELRIGTLAGGFEAQIPKLFGHLVNALLSGDVIVFSALDGVGQKS